jgi:hypothetical protein
MLPFACKVRFANCIQVTLGSDTGGASTFCSAQIHRVITALTGPRRKEINGYQLPTVCDCEYRNRQIL